MDRCALFVDAGYLLGEGAMAVHGTRQRDAVSWDFNGLLQLLNNLAGERTGLPLLRCYWYEATVEGRRTLEHDALADLPGLKLRLGRIRPGRREGVDSEIHRDLMTLARNSALSEAVLVSGDEDLAQVVADAQDLGVRVTIVHVAVDGNWTISRLLRQECDDLIEIGSGHLRPYVNLLAGADGGGSSHTSGGSVSSAPSGSVLPGAAMSSSGAGPLSNGHGNGVPIGDLQPAAQHGPPSASPITGPPRSVPSASTAHSEHAPLPSSSAHPAPAEVSTGPSALPSESAHSAGGHSVGGHSVGGHSVGGHSAGGQTTTGPMPAPAAHHTAQPPPPPAPEPAAPASGGYGAGVLDSGPLSGPAGSGGLGADTFGSNTLGSGTSGSGGFGGSFSGGGAPLPSAPVHTGPSHAGPSYAAPSQPQQVAAPAPSAPSAAQQYASPQVPAPSPPSAPQQLPANSRPGPYTGPQQLSPVPAQQNTPSLADAVKAAHQEGQDFGESVARDAPALWLEAVLARKPRMPSDLEARLLQGSSLPIDFLLHDEVRHALRRGFWDALENSRR